MNKYSTETLIAGSLLLFLLSACGNQKPSAAASDTTPKTDSTTNTKFFPISDYLASEIRYVDTTPLAILKCETLHDKTDSAFLTPAEFHRLATTFLGPELDPDTLEKNYTESSFGDKTTGYINFTYTPKDRSLALRRIDVVVAAGEGMDKVKSIYLEKIDRLSDTVMIKKMYWQARKSFLIITSLQAPAKKPTVRQLKVVWNNEEED